MLDNQWRNLNLYSSTTVGPNHEVHRNMRIDMAMPRGTVHLIGLAFHHVYGSHSRVSSAPNHWTCPYADEFWWFCTVDIDDASDLHCDFYIHLFSRILGAIDAETTITGCRDLIAHWVEKCGRKNEIRFVHDSKFEVIELQVMGWFW